MAFFEALVLTSVFSPGTVVVVLGGALAAQGIYDIGDMMWFVGIGTVLGSQASFWLGTIKQDGWAQLVAPMLGQNVVGDPFFTEGRAAKLSRPNFLPRAGLRNIRGQIQTSDPKRSSEKIT